VRLLYTMRHQARRHMFEEKREARGLAAFVAHHSASPTNGRTGVSCRCLADTGFQRTSALRGGGASRAPHLNRKRKDIFVAITTADNRESERAFVQDRQGQRYLR